MLTCLLLSSLALAEEPVSSEVETETQALEGAAPSDGESVSPSDEGVEGPPTEEELHYLEAASFYKVALNW